MIGNTIKFRYYNWKNPEYKPIEEIPIIEGIVVDAYTEITGNVNGKSSSFLGFGDGNVTGITESQRIYKVQHHKDWDIKKQYSVQLSEIKHWQVLEIVKFAGQSNQEQNEEKFKEK